MTGGKKVLRFLLRLLGALVSVVLLALVAVSLILAKPQEERAEAPAATPSLSASPAVQAESERDLPRLIGSFPAPVMSFMSGSGMVFVSGTSADAAVDGGFGRIVTLFWQTPEGEPMTLRSIWPASALSLLEDGFHFMAETGPVLFGSTSVRMENDDAVRFHVATDKGLYAVLLPRSLSRQAVDLCRSLQLFTVDPQD